MPIPKIISLHPRLAAGLHILVGLLFIWWLRAGIPLISITSVGRLAWWFLLNIIWWAILVQVTFSPPFLSRLQHWLSLMIFLFGTLGLFLFVEVSGVVVVLLLLMLLVPAASFWLIPDRSHTVAALGKTARSWRFLMLVFGVAGAWTATLALSAFQLYSGLMLVLVVAASLALTLFISFLGWRFYDLPFGWGEGRVLGVLGLIMAELTYAIHTTAMGYFLGALVTTWVWYVLWLLMRFSFTAEGIDWKRQRGFLIGNVVLFVIFLLFVVRWK